MQPTVSPPSMNPPPPIPRHALDDDQARRRLWYTIAAILLLLLLILLLIAWLLSASSGSGLAGKGGEGMSGDTTGRLGEGGGPSTSSSTRPPSSLGSTQGNASGDKAKPQPDADSATDNSAATGKDADSDAANNSGGTETSLLIYDSPDDTKPATPAIANTDKPPASGSAGAGKGDEIVDAGGTNPFIGKGPPARSTVYVVDSSSSMAADSRLVRVKSSLSRAIEQLKPERKFKVFFFSDSFVTDNIGRGLLPASKRNKDRVFQWIEQQSPIGGTNPLPAMLEAIKLMPEKIVLMSDGEFDPTSVDIITQANQDNKSKKSRIDCAGLAERIETLREIARQNDGTYYQVN